MVATTATVAQFEGKASGEQVNNNGKLNDLTNTKLSSRARVSRDSKVEIRSSASEEEEEERDLCRQEVESLSIKSGSSGRSGGSSRSSGSGKMIKCSAMHTLERDMPDFDYSNLIAQMREKLLVELEDHVGRYADKEIEKCKNDDWHLARYLIRQKMDVDAACEMLLKSMRFKHDHLSSVLRPEDFPREFHLLGALFNFEHDRKGNRVLYMRIKLHRKVPEIQSVLEAFIFHNISRIDEEANGRGIVIVLDCTGAGVSNVDMDALMFLISSLKNYFPKGLSYLLVHNLPWILKPFWHIAKLCIPDEYTKIIHFSNSNTILEYIDSQCLPNYFPNSTCEKDHITVPENCTTILQATKLWGIESGLIKKVMLRFMSDLPEESLKILNELEDCPAQEEEEEAEKKQQDKEA